MATKKKKTSSSKAKASIREAQFRQMRIRREIASIVCMALGVFLAFALHSSSAGIVGGWFAALLSGLFGAMAKALPFFLIGFGLFLLLAVQRRVSLLPVVLLSAVFLLLSVVLAVHFVEADGTIPGGAGFLKIFSDSAGGEAGGVVGMYAAMGLVKAIGKVGVYILVIALIVICGILSVGVPMSQLAADARERGQERREVREQRRAEREALWAQEEAGNEASGRYYDKIAAPERRAPQPGLRWPSFLVNAFKPEVEDGPIPDGRQNILNAVKNDETYGDVGVDGKIGAPGAAAQELPEDLPFVPDPEGSLKEAIRDSASKDAAAAAAAKPRRKPEAGEKMHYGAQMSDANYKLPPIDLLGKARNTGLKETNPALKAGAARLEQALRDFRVEAKVAKVTVGPTVTRYEVEPDVGVRIQNIRSLEPDLALKLEVKSVRVVPMPGTSTVGIEAYNENSTVVTLREIIDSEEFRGQKSRIAFALGKNISGKRIVADLSKMPHLLIAGTTGSGKSVCINSILLSLLYRARPSEVKLILVDPKVVELEAYSDIPHLLVPVVTDPERASMALAYAVAQMEERYRMFSAEGVRNLEGFNNKLRREGRTEEVLPEIVIVIDELADLMIVASAKVQDSISRLAAKARAAGMHLIVATQQPLASILTSVIKANIPSRIALSVASNSASRVILDQPGAERLLGNGDMLFAPVGEREPMRIQGAFVSDAEVAKVTAFIKKQMDPDYSQEAIVGVESAFEGGGTDDGDEFFIDAVEMVAQTKLASVSMIQRRFRIGYNRAARIVDMMEERGIVGPSDGTNKPRRLIMTDAQLAGFLSSAGRKEPEGFFGGGDAAGGKAAPAEPAEPEKPSKAPKPAAAQAKEPDWATVPEPEPEPAPKLGLDPDTGPLPFMAADPGPVDTEAMRRYVTTKDGDVDFASIFDE
ncbi:MAG: DNA translocase FtsK [Clostridiales Family XIII bacterium]|jgi:S-DNA-T family DNA segregation ATPase FtsK/SpoIIIE|nr:DNA translocase FtsK [Clostridiales Family XIII bacterium]